MAHQPHAANRPNLLDSIAKLAVAGERAGFSVEEMISLLNAGMTVETLVDLVAQRLDLLGLVDYASAPKEYRVWGENEIIRFSILRSLPGCRGN